jgi:DnaK suppressor protein
MNLLNYYVHSLYWLQPISAFFIYLPFLLVDNKYMLNQNETEEYKKILEAKREDLMAKIQGESMPDNQPNDTTDNGDEEATEAEAFADQLALAQTHRDAVQEIDSTLERIRNGSYGTCDKCGEEISKEVLDIAPESSLCENCKLSAI